MTLRFNSDGTFRVLQMADIQDGPNVREDTIRLIEAAIKKTHPDLIVFTGDQIRGYDPAYIDTFLRRRGEQPGTHIRAVTEIEAKIRGIKRHPFTKALLEQPPTDDNWMIDGIGTDSPKLVKRNKRDGRNGSANKLESWAQSINRATAATILDSTRQKVRDTFAAFLGPALEARIPFAATYGNHDFQCGILADEQDDLYREFSGCMNPVAGSSPLALEPGTFAIPIEASDGSGRIAMSVMMVNSGDYADNAFDGDRSNSGDREHAGDTGKSGNTVGNAAGGRESLTSYAKYASNSRGWDLADSDGYGTPSPEAIEWLKQVQRELGERNGDGLAVPAIAFQHIPPQEFYDCLREVPAYTPNAVEGARTFAGHCYVLNRDVCRPGSRLGEAIGCADENVGEVQALRDAGGYFALFCGHDHKNAFVGHVHDIDLGYAPTCGFECYGPKSRLRGIRLFEFRENNPVSYVTRMLTWGDLVGRYSGNELRVFFEDHCVTGAATCATNCAAAGVATVALTLSAGFAAIVRSIARRCDDSAAAANRRQRAWFRRRYRRHHAYSYPPYIRPARPRAGPTSTRSGTARSRQGGTTFMWYPPFSGTAWSCQAWHGLTRRQLVARAGQSLQFVAADAGWHIDGVHRLVDFGLAIRRARPIAGFESFLAAAAIVAIRPMSSMPTSDGTFHQSSPPVSVRRAA